MQSHVSFKKGERGWFDWDRNGIGNVTTKEILEWCGHQKLEEAKTGFFHPAWKEYGPADNLISEFWSLELRANTVQLFSATTLWHFFLYLPKEMKTLGLLKLDIFLKGPENYHINPKRCRHSIEGNPYIFSPNWIRDTQKVTEWNVIYKYILITPVLLLKSRSEG